MEEICQQGEDEAIDLAAIWERDESCHLHLEALQGIYGAERENPWAESHKNGSDVRVFQVSEGKGGAGQPDKDSLSVAKIQKEEREVQDKRWGRLFNHPTRQVFQFDDQEFPWQQDERNGRRCWCPRWEPLPSRFFQEGYEEACGPTDGQEPHRKHNAKFTQKQYLQCNKAKAELKCQFQHYSG